MKHSLYYKFILGYLVFGLIGFLSIATLASSITYHYLLRKEADTLYDMANIIASKYGELYSGKNVDLDKNTLWLEGATLSSQSEIWIIHPQGKVVASSNPTKKNTVIEYFDPLSMGNKSYSVGQFYNQFSTDNLSVLVPITGNYHTYGYVGIHMPVSQIHQTRDHILNIIYITAAFIFLLSLIILLIFRKTVYFPIKKITQGANEYASGNLTHEIKIHSQDEIGYLAATLNYMSDELNKTEEYQRTFIANISHDFRSPLTSIKGYLEAILDGTIPQEIHEKYLNLVISETERLNKLTQGMLTLNSLDNKGRLTRSTFDINQTIKNTVAAFEGTCTKKNIIFELTFFDTAQPVYADLEKIQRVLYNLIDNAIKFSHNDSQIYIETSQKYEKIFVSVKDTGIGIPKESMKKIWERFYKTDLSRGKDKHGTGLGLSIVKEIIQSHGENIDVISTQDVGTEFIFSLPKTNT